MSNFKDSDYKASIEMYHKSFEYLQVDHIDYYLLHSFGGVDESGKSVFEKRFLDNGVLEFLLKEREAGRIRNLDGRSTASSRNSTRSLPCTTSTTGTSPRYR